MKRDRNEQRYCQGQVHEQHPTSQFRFDGFEIPHWNAIVKLCKQTQLAFGYYKLLGLDIAVTEDEPVLIEINSAHDNVGLEQAYGPILRRDEVRRAFSEYSLLINTRND